MITGPIKCGTTPVHPWGRCVFPSSKFQLEGLRKQVRSTGDFLPITRTYSIQNVGNTD